MLIFSKLIFHPYTFTHLLTFLSYPFVRSFYLNRTELDGKIGFGITREGLMTILFLAIIAFKFNSYWTIEHFIVLIAWYVKILILMLVYFGKAYQIMFLYIASWIGIWVLIEVPKYSERSEMIELNYSEFYALFESKTSKQPLLRNRFVFLVLFSDLSQESILVILTDRTYLG